MNHHHQEDTHHLAPDPGDQPPSLASTMACFGEVHSCGLCDRRTTSIASPSTSLDLPRQSMLGEKNSPSRFAAFKRFGVPVRISLFASSFECRWLSTTPKRVFTYGGLIGL